MSNPAYVLSRPTERTTSVIFASPHSGRDYCENFLAQTTLDAAEIRSSEDAFVDLLYADAPLFGAPFLVAKAPRAFVDLNRGVQEMDSALINGVRRLAQNARVASGLGVIPRVVANGRQIYNGKLSLEEAHARLNTVWRPYHDALQTLIDESHARFDEAILIDCHSMPREAMNVSLLSGDERPDIVLGDRYGAAASAGVVDRIETAFTSAGFKVARNMPFAGAFITQQYGRPSRRQHAIQVEIDRSLYMDETTLQKTANFDDLRQVLSGVMSQITQIGRSSAARVAAE